MRKPISRLAPRLFAPALAIAFQLAPAQRTHAQANAGAFATGEHESILNGVRLWYDVAGTSAPNTPPVIFLHGGPGYNSYSFARIAGPSLEKSLRMVYLDQRGSGRSERPWTRDYKMQTLVADVDALRRALGVRQVALIGHSFGGVLALEYAAAHPENVSKLVLVDILFDAPLQCRYRRESLAALRPESYARVAKDTMDSAGVHRSDCELEFRALRGADREAFSNEMMFPDSSRRLAQDSVDKASGLRNTGELSNALFNAGLLNYRFTAWDRLTNIPALVIAGGKDRAVGGPPARELARRLAKGRYVELPRGGHFPYLEEPDAFAREVSAFLVRRDQ